MDDAEHGRCDSRCAWLYATNQLVVKLECHQLAITVDLSLMHCDRHLFICVLDNFKGLF